MPWMHNRTQMEGFDDYNVISRDKAKNKMLRRIKLSKKRCLSNG